MNAGIKTQQPIKEMHMNLWNFLFGKVKSKPGRKSTVASVKANILESIEHVRGGCWLWQGSCWNNGIGVIGATCLGQRTMAVHRAAYIIWKGSLDRSEYVFRTCLKDTCCNPAHLVKGRSRADSPKYDRR